MSQSKRKGIAMLEPCNIGPLVVCRIENGERITNVPHRIVRHSPTGFAWGYSGSGPADLALNMLCCVVGQKTAEPLYQRFKEKFIAALPEQGGTISVQAIRDWVAGKARLEAAEALFVALEELFEEQNGRPLITRTQQWEEAMEKARLALRAWRVLGQETGERD